MLQNEVQEISWIDGKLQLADCFTKQGALQAQLLQLLVDQFSLEYRGNNMHILCLIKCWKK